LMNTSEEMINSNYNKGSAKEKQSTIQDVINENLLNDLETETLKNSISNNFISKKSKKKISNNNNEEIFSSDGEYNHDRQLFKQTQKYQKIDEEDENELEVEKITGFQWNEDEYQLYFDLVWKDCQSESSVPLQHLHCDKLLYDFLKENQK
jgi:hypothetical protein